MQLDLNINYSDLIFIFPWWIIHFILEISFVIKEV